MFRIPARLLFAAAVCIAATACGPTPQPTGGSESRRAEGQTRDGARKAMIMATSTEPAHLGGFQVVGTGYQGPIYQMVHDFLVVHDDQGRPQPHLAEALPSMETGTWTVSPDGPMETIWRLRAGPKGHDGTPLSAQDIAFTWQVANNPDIPWSRPAYARRIAEITTTGCDDACHALEGNVSLRSSAGGDDDRSHPNPPPSAPVRRRRPGVHQLALLDP